MVDHGGAIRIIRPVNCVMVGLAVLVGVVISVGSSMYSSVQELALAFLTGFFMTASAMAINDYFDREIDTINEPERPIPSGAVSSIEAIMISGVTSILGLGAAWLTSIGNLVVAVFAWAAMMFYSTYGKKTGFLGNLIVSICIAIPFIYGGIMIGGSAINHSIIFALIAFLANTGREVTKDIVDVEGDQAMGIRTVAISMGVTTAALVSVVFYISAVIVSILPLYYGFVSFWYFPFVVVTDIGLVYLSFSLIRDSSRENSRRIKNMVRMLMLCGLFGFLIGSLT